MARKKWDVCTPRPKGREEQDGSWWHRIGRAIENDKGQIHVYLDSLPFPDREGRVFMALFEPREEGKDNDRGTRGHQSRSSGGRPAPSQLDDDEIPF